MPIPLAVPIAIGAGTAAAGLFGGRRAGKDKGDAAAIQQAIDQINSLQSPSVQDLTYNLDRLVSQGQLTPEQAKAIFIEKTAMEGVAVDPQYKAAQLEALSQLKAISDAGGMTLRDKANLEDIISRQAAEERGARDAIMQNQRAMGRGGSGMELASKLMAQQGGATRAAQQGLDVAATAQERALQAIMQGGQMAGGMREQEFGEQARIAEAKDALARFNAANLQATEEANVGRRMAAKAQNLAEAQRIADQNVALAGEERKIRAGARQAQYENEMAKRNAVATMLGEKARNIREKQKEKAGFYGNIVGLGGNIAGLAALKSDERSKNIENEEPDLDEFMESLKPLAFTYKNPSSPGASDGRNIGVTAQDVEKTPAGRTMVVNTPDGKMLDMQKGFGVILAALAALHDKIESEKS